MVWKTTGNFFFNSRKETSIYSRIPNPRFNVPVVNVGIVTNGIYGKLFEFEYAAEFKPDRDNDCLIFAESLSCNMPGYSDEASMFKEKKTGIPFGESDEENIRIVSRRNVPDDEFANPDIGEAYAIITMIDIDDNASNKMLYPYHIAYVIAKDNGFNITLEANAADDVQKPIFDAYNLTNDTFYTRYIDMFTFRSKRLRKIVDPHAIVLTKI